MSTPDLEKEGRQAEPTLAIDDSMRPTAPPVGSPPSGVAYLESSTLDLEKKESLAARRHQTRSTAVTDDEDDDDPTSLADTKLSAKRSWWTRLNPLKPKRKPPVPEERTVSPEYGASLWSRVTFRWMAPLMTVGYQRPLEVNDIWLVNPERSADVMAAKLTASLNQRAARGDRYPLFWAMYDTFKIEFWVGGTCQLVTTILQVMTPYTLRYLIQFATEAYVAQRSPVPRAGPPIGRGVGLALAIAIMQVMQSLTTHHFIYRGMMVGAQSRAVLISVIFEKAMRISGRAKAGGRAITAGDSTPEAPNEEKESKKKHKQNGPKVPIDTTPGVSGDGMGWSNGRVVNLMSTDTYRIDQASGMFHIIWTAPIAMVLTLVLLLVNLTYSALAGFGLLVLGTPIFTWAIKALFVRRAAINKVTDQRVGLTQEILQAVRFVKYFGWESSFLERLGAIRRREIRAIQVLLTIRNAVNAVSMSLPTFASMLAFITYALTSHDLTPARIFSSLALFNALRLPLNLLPLVIGQVTDGWSSICRIQEYLLAEEMKDEFTWEMEGKTAVKVIDADFTWERTATQDPDQQSLEKPRGKKVRWHTKKAEKEAEKMHEAGHDGKASEDDASSRSEETPFSLKSLNIDIGRDELIAVIGSVGSGKSSLLAALAGDMRKTRGEVTMGASRAFCPQYAWIQNATVRENILFGKEYDSEWYAKVIEACALGPDLKMLPNGDETEIGERGITVSGGQKQRINIARAIYFNSDLILMDDPLSAVDAHVGRHIFDHAICGLMQNKCRILATHQLHVPNRCDRIIWMQEGHIAAIDTYDNLMANDEGFAKMMVGTAADEEESESEQEGAIKSSKKKKKSKPVPALMQAEERAVKSVPWSVYRAYISASGSLINGPLLILLLVIAQGANIVTSLWLSYWVSDKFRFSMGQYIGVYAGLGVLQALLMFFFAISLTMLGTTASKVMMNRAMKRVLHAPMSFFDTTPLGRITNRFSKDVDIMDNNLTDSMRMYFFTLSMIISVFILIIVFFHYFAIALGPLFVAFLFSANYYRASAREMKRHESLLRSVVFAKFGEALSGTACIRAYGLQSRFIHAIRDAVDDMDSAYYLTISNQRWLSVRLDTVGNLLVFTTAILVVTSRFSVSPSIGGLVLSYILAITQMIQFTVRQLAEVENAMNATERLHYYGTQLEEEAPLQLGDVRDSWPERGEIVFEHVQMRYRANLPLVLQDLTLHVRGGERVGIVGRTGAGKSSIMTTLFRLVELSGGSITIDGLDISKIGLRALRSRLAIIPQDPTLFRGTIRSNLDPFNEHTDLELWSALRQSDLVHDEAGLEDKTPGRIHLDGIVEEEGLNFSLGQRQLMALARALVRGSQIIVCDEATSSVDLETDQKIQRTMATGFEGKTVLCIAHRLRTIIHYDRICVMDAGRIAELDTPLALFEKEGGIFRGMCERSGIRSEDFVRRD
ncbi:MAG: hypothetical protein M1823_003635 [Watsoniomyces obsoletus]|nr:MAG: hypothetical protein M1823_003635 [Watsoniomyces obsoletus]